MAFREKKLKDSTQFMHITTASTDRSYQVSHNGTEIDRQCLEFLRYFELPIMHCLSVGGLSQPIKRTFGKKHLPDMEIISDILYRLYQVQILLSPQKLGLSDFVSGLFINATKKRRTDEERAFGLAEFHYPKYAEEIAIPLKTAVLTRLDAFINRFDIKATTISMAADEKLRLKFEFYLPVKPFDLVNHAGEARRILGPFLADVTGIQVAQNKKPLSSYDLAMLYMDREKCAEYALEIDSCYRKDNDIQERGVLSVSQSMLAALLRSKGLKVEVETNAGFLGRQRFDMFLPEIRVAIEYHGEQHYHSIEFFGGKQGLSQTRARDEKKLCLSQSKMVPVLIWPYTIPVTPDTVSFFMKLIDIGKKVNGPVSFWMHELPASRP